MSKAQYVSLKDISGIQMTVMEFVTIWVHQKRTTVPRKEIMLMLKEKGINRGSAENAVYALINKGYIRPSIATSNKTSYVMLRGI